MLNKGLHQNRFDFATEERFYAEAWEGRNTANSSGPSFLNGKGVLDYLLAEDNNNPCGEVTDRDRVVAATVIQWLGSHVGNSFLEEVKKRKEDEEAFRKEKRFQELKDQIAQDYINKRGW